MIHAMIRHKVADYAQWKVVFDETSPLRAAASSVKGHIFRDVDDPSIVTILTHFEDDEKAKAFLQSPELAEAMQAAGVVGESEIILLGQEEKFVD